MRGCGSRANHHPSTPLCRVNLGRTGQHSNRRPHELNRRIIAREHSRITLSIPSCSSCVLRLLTSSPSPSLTMGKSKFKTVPVIPLPKGQVLLPGVSLRIAIAYRPDIAALLAYIYSTLNNPKVKSPITIGCVPLGSHLLSPDGKKLLPESEGEQHLEKEIHPASARQGDLYGYGTLAKVSGVQGRVQGELSLVVEGLSRFRIDKFLQERPYFEAQIESLPEAGRLACISRSGPFADHCCRNQPE